MDKYCDMNTSLNSIIKSIVDNGLLETKQIGSDEQTTSNLQRTMVFSPMLTFNPQ